MRKSGFRPQHRNAVSEIVATVIMLVIVVALGVIIFVYATTGLTSFGTGFSNLLGNSGNAIAEQISVEQVTFNLTSGPSPYVPITITNSQTLATPAPFEQSMTINPSQYTSLEGTDIGNIRFFATFSGSAFSNPIDSWLESFSGSSSANTALSATFWLNIAAGIGASSAITVYMVFEPTSTEFDGSVAGEAPQLSPTYGVYDNGANVFTLYGGGGATGWSAFTFVGGTWDTTKGYLEQTSTTGNFGGGPTALIESTSFSNAGSYVLESAFNYTTQAVARVGIIAVGTPVAGPDVQGYRFIGQQSNNGPGFLSFLNDLKAWVVSNTYSGSVSTDYTMQVVDSAGTWSGALYPGFSTSSSPLTTLASTPYVVSNNQGATTGYVGISASYYTGSAVVGNPMSIQWFRMRALPPNSVMPSQSLGTSHVGSQPGANIYVRNTGVNSVTIAAVYVQNITANTFVGSFQLTPTVTISPGSFQDIALAFKPTTGPTYSFTVTTQLGTSVLAYGIS
ncbi:MAG: archaellin/type IV pilin N-terminal domain-containing protein [Nitrososphaerales archaeon]